MNRRRFIQSLAAMFTLPASASIPLPATAAVAPAAAVAVPANARFWAIYISALHGECTPQTLQNMLHIPEMDAKRYISQLITDGVIRPNPLLQHTVSRLVRGDDENLVDKVKDRFEKKSREQSGAPEMQEALDADGTQAPQPPSSDAAEDDKVNDDNHHDHNTLGGKAFRDGSDGVRDFGDPEFGELGEGDNRRGDGLEAAATAADDDVLVPFSSRGDETLIEEELAESQSGLADNSGSPNADSIVIGPGVRES